MHLLAPTPAPRVSGVARALVVFVGLALCVPLASAAPRVSEYALKAEFVERFAAFATWPAEALGPADPFVICVRGESPIKGYLDEVARRKRIKQRRVTVRTLGSASPVSGCHLLFLPDAAGRDLSKTLEAVSTRPILTIGDTEGFGRRGVMINMIRRGQYVRFEINRGALDASHLRLPAKVLRLGREVKTR